MYAQVGLQLTMSTMPAKVYRASLYKVSSPVVCNGMCTSKNEMWIFKTIEVGWTHQDCASIQLAR